jgi:pimeloyl-ACP methyl ester carboxylesterase
MFSSASRGTRRAIRDRRPPLAALLTAVALVATMTPMMTSEAGAATPYREPDTALLAGTLTRQVVSWGPCDFSTVDVSSEEVRQKLLAVPGLACADITVPRDWHQPRDGNTITLRISKTATSEGADRQGIALVNPGGPGGRGVHWGAGMAIRAPELAKKYDFIGFDPRGVGDSTPLFCNLPSDPPTGADENAATEYMVDGCRNETPLTKYITTEQTAYDMDFIRVLLGRRTMSYIGYSYGTWLGAWYAATFPGKVHRMLLDSSTDVAEPSLERTFTLQDYARERAFQEQLLPYVARNPQYSETGDLSDVGGNDPKKIRQAWEEAGGTRTILGQVFVNLLIIPAMYHTVDYPSAAFAVSYLIRALRAMKPGAANDPATAVKVANAAIDRQLSRPKLSEDGRAPLLQARAGVAVWAEKHTKGVNAADAQQIPPEIAAFWAIRCQDGQWHQDPGYWEAAQQRLDRKAPFIAPFSRNYLLGDGSKTLYPECAYWPTTNRMPRVDRRTFPNVMIAQDEVDAATAYEGALASALYLPRVHMVSVDNEGSHGVFPYHTTCVDDPIDAYFLRGERPRHEFTACQGLPLPNEDRTYEVGGPVVGTRGHVTEKAVSRDTRRVDEWFKRHIPAPYTPVGGTTG